MMHESLVAAPEGVPTLTSVHDALTNAVLTTKNQQELVNATFKIHPLKKELVRAICERNGTDLSTFVRACCEGLLADYCEPREYDRLHELGLEYGRG